nr:GDP-mannose 4,6-dehydratase [uncultured Rhodopila sp.]
MSGIRDDFWRHRRVFVTGATGFLGSWMVQELRSSGAFVVALVRDLPGKPTILGTELSQPDFTVMGELEDYDCLLRTLNEYEIESVMHLAAQPIVGIALRDPRGTFETNIRGTWNLLEACRQISTVRRIVVASTDKVYGTADRLPCDESMPLLGRHPYDVSKSCADIIAQGYHTTYNLPVCITRCANIYGGGDLNFSRIVPGTIQLVSHGKAPVLRSDGTMIRDYIYIRDVVGGYLRLAEAMEQPEIWGHAYNFSVEKPLSVVGITEKVLIAMGRRELLPVILNEARAEIQEQYLSSARARRELNWKPIHTLEESLAETVAWYRAWFVRSA